MKKSGMDDPKVGKTCDVGKLVKKIEMGAPHVGKFGKKNEMDDPKVDKEASSRKNGEEDREWETDEQRSRRVVRKFENW